MVHKQAYPNIQSFGGHAAGPSPTVYLRKQYPSNAQGLNACVHSF